MGTGGLFLRRLRSMVADSPTGFVWVEKNKLAASGYPASRRQLEWVRSQGVSSVLTLTEYPLPSDWTVQGPMSFAHVPMKDHEPPTQESLERAATLIASNVQAGRALLVHCLAGQGRTMCAIAAYMIKKNGATAESAISELRRVRPGAVENGQEQSLIEYEKSVRQRT